MPSTKLAIDQQLRYPPPTHIEEHRMHGSGKAWARTVGSGDLGVLGLDAQREQHAVVYTET